MSEQRNYMAEVQSLIDLKWKENPEEMKRVMAEIKAKEKQKAKAKTPKRVSFDPKLTQELIEKLNKAAINMSEVQDLIKRGADVDAEDDRGETPLHKASANNAIETAKLLIEKGANLEAKTDWGWTPLHWANSVAIADLLIEAGADVNAKKVDGWTPLHLASWNNHIEIAKLLLDRGADVEAKDNDGRTPLDWAKYDEIKTLLQKYMK